MNYGDLFWANLPNRDGREQSGRRPVIIWQDTTGFSWPTVLVIPLSTRMNTLRFPATMLLQPTPRNGLVAASVALVFQLGACDLHRFGNQLGALDDADLQSLQLIAKQLQLLP